MKILVIGSNGQLGQCIYDQIHSCDYNLHFSSRAEIDITDFIETRRKISEINPDLIIDASAYTDVGKAETNKKIASLINHHAVDNMATICRDLNCWLFHISTDFVFDGKNKHPYNEDDEVNPQSVYGISKLMGEVAIKEKCKRYLIIRTSWLFSEYGKNFLKTMVYLGQKRKELSIVGDQYGCPTYAQDLAIAISLIIKKLNTRELTSGIYHFCGNKSCSWFDFAKAIFLEAEVQGFVTPKNLSITTSKNYDTKVNRPKYSALDCSKIFSEFNIYPSDWIKGIKSSLNKL